MESLFDSHERGGWHVISSDDLLALLRRVAAGEDPEMVYIEEYANASHQHVPGDRSYEGEAYESFQDFLDNEGGHL